ncbi:Uncharacterised protein [Shigella sonnei]|nr:Uncharacterised protein [Shigella sonnei]
MGNEDKSDTERLLQFFQFQLHLLTQFEIQCAERFIQQQYARFIHQCSGDSNPLALTTRKL